MAKKTAKSATTKEQDTTQKVAKNLKTGSILADFLEGVPHYPIFCFNPHYNSGTEEDRWFFVLPIEGSLIVVKTAYRGFTNKSDLSQMALSLMANPDRALEHMVEDYPSTDNVRNLKMIGLRVQRFSLA